MKCRVLPLVMGNGLGLQLGFRFWAVMDLCCNGECFWMGLWLVEQLGVLFLVTGRGLELG